MDHLDSADAIILWNDIFSHHCADNSFDQWYKSEEHMGKTVEDLMEEEKQKEWGRRLVEKKDAGNGKLQQTLSHHHPICLGEMTASDLHRCLCFPSIISAVHEFDLYKISYKSFVVFSLQYYATPFLRVIFLRCHDALHTE